MRSKPANMKYTDLCIYIDSVLYYRDENNNPTAVRELNDIEIDNVYTYLYHLTYALAVKKKLFNSAKDYDEFSLEAASRFYQRLTSPDQEAEPTSKIKKPFIKSVLNYIKGAIGFMAISYRQEHYAEILNPEHDSEEDLQGARMWVENEVNSQFTSQIRDDIIETFSFLPAYVNKVSDESIYRKNKYKLNNLKLSILLTLLNTLTLEKKYVGKVEKKKQALLLRQLEDRKNYTLLWNDANDLTPQIIDLNIRKAFELLENDINDIKKAYTLDDNILDEIIKSALPTYGLDQSGD